MQKSRNMVDLRDKIRKIIETERNKDVTVKGVSQKHFSILGEKDVDLIQQIFSNDEYMNRLNQDFQNIPKNADLIFVAAPTGAGKDSLVAKLEHDRPEKNYIELNMDRFRLYYKSILPDLKLQDITYAEQTNELSYEIYYVIQQLLLNEFPGTNVIITGTLGETDWVENTFRMYKANEFTNYRITLASLAVPYMDSAFSILKRYVSLVDMYILDKNADGTVKYKDGFAPRKR